MKNSIRIAVLIPAFNEELLIEQTILSLVAAGVKKEDIYVVDDGSEDDTAAMALRCGVIVSSNPSNIGKSASITRALREFGLLSRYTHVSFLDADTRVDSKYFKTVRQRIKSDPSVGVICGHPKSIAHNYLTAYRAFSYFLMDMIYKPAQSKLRSVMVVPGCAATYSVGALKKIAWTADTRAEDMDATVQALLANEKIVYVSDAIVYTQDPSTIRDYIGQVGRRWYKGSWQIMRKHGLLWRGWLKILNWECRLIFLEPFAYLGIFYWVYTRNPERMLWATVQGLLIIMAVAAYAAIRERRADIFLWSFLFPVLRILDYALFLGASWNLVKGGDGRHSWYCIPRYATKKS
ncbi:MAG: glycosyltransferase family 2 protein [bacterium]|nr:glycosyltransferase family 2 protein [bacterium]